MHAAVALLYYHTIISQYRLGCGFNIYEATTKTYVENEIYDTIGGPDRSSLMMCKILDHVKTRYCEISKYIAEWTQEEKDPHIARWLA